MKVPALGLALLLCLIGCGGGGSNMLAPSPSPGGSPGSGGGGTGSGGGTPPAGSIHVAILVEENEAYEAIVGNDNMPYLNSLIPQGAVANQYFADAHPSLPNYFMLTTGQTITKQNDSFTGTVTEDNIVRELVAAGKTWKSYAESLPSVGYTGPDQFPYLQHHNPFVFFSDVLNDSKQAANLVPFTQLATDMAANALPDYSFIVPNMNNDAHDCPAGMSGCTETDKLSNADKWLQANIAPLLSSPAFSNGLLIIVFDESNENDTQHGGGRVLFLALGSKANAGTQTATFYQHENALKLTCNVLGLTTCPGAAAAASGMPEVIH
jgi:hypothetical protein